jgi:hypothetical protein
MNCTGVLTLGAVVRFEHTADNTPQLLLHAYAPGLSANGAAYKLVWTGHEAEAFYTLNEHRLHLGTRLSVTLASLQPLVQDGQSYIMATVSGIEVLSGDAQPVTKAVGAHYTPRPVVKSRWVNLPGVTA